MTDHLIIAVAETCGCRQFAPDLHPLSGLFIDFLLANLDDDVTDHGMADVIDPKVVHAAGAGNRREIDLKEHATEELGLAGNQAADALAKIQRTVELNGNGLDCEWRVTTVDLLVEGELGRSSEIGILPTTCDEL